jgi:riboflavin synthase
MLIPYTQAHSTLSSKKAGASVNLEVDQMGKYVESAVTGMLQGGGPLQKMIEDCVKRIVGDRP